MKKSIVSPTFLRQKARQLKREKTLGQHQALDEAARELGYTNYKNYLNILKANRDQFDPSNFESSKELYVEKISSEKDICKKMNLAISFIQRFEIPFHEQLDILKMFQLSDDSNFIQIMCEKLSLMKDAIQSYLLSDFLTDEGKAEIQLWQPYFVAKEISLSDLTYKINEGMLYVDGNYDLKTEFEFEIDEDNSIKIDDRFNDRELFGTFEIKIDRNKRITIENSDIGEKYDGILQAESFR